jgi:hydrogenase expression/formation protein HypC
VSNVDRTSIAEPAEQATGGRNTPSCITCGDVALPMRIVALGGDGLARCEGDAGSCEVDVGLLERVEVGDEVLVHAGVAIA